MRRGPLLATGLLGVALGVGSASVAEAGEVDLARFDPGGRVRAVRALDVDGDGRTDLVLLVQVARPDAAPANEVVVLRTPKDPDRRTFFRNDDVTRIPCDGAGAGDLATAGAVAVGRFGERGRVLLRFLGEDVRDVAPDGRPVPSAEGPRPTLLARSHDLPISFWDAVADLDGDGVDECWYPDRSGHVRLKGLDLAATDEAQRSPTELFLRKSRMPALTPADVDGDGVKELVHLDGTALVVEHPFAKTAVPPTRVELPFLAPDPSRPPEELRSPRLTLADVDGDGKVDLLVTLVQGRADKVGGLRTSLYHFPGPFVNPATGALVEPRGRIDTESVALHPRFVDVTGDGKLDYVADSIRGTMMSLIQRVMGQEPEVTFTVFRFVRETGTFERSPYVTIERPYSSSEARGNTFGRSGFFEGDFDGDGVRDLLDLGNLKGVAIWKGTAGEDAFEKAILPRTAIDKDRTLAPDAVIADLNGDGRADAVLWSEDALYLVLSKGAR